MVRLEVRDGSDGERVISLECDDRIPGEEVGPWLVALSSLVQMSGRLVVSDGLPPSYAATEPNPSQQFSVPGEEGTGMEDEVLVIDPLGRAERMR